jgi:hypothetical protein
MPVLSSFMLAMKRDLPPLADSLHRQAFRPLMTSAMAAKPLSPGFSPVN